MNFYENLEQRLVYSLDPGATESRAIKIRLLIRFSLAFTASKILLLFLSIQAEVTWFKLIQASSIASVTIVFAMLRLVKSFRFSVATFVALNMCILTVYIFIMGGRIQTINNAWFPLFLILAYLLVGKRFGLVTIFIYSIIVFGMFLLRQGGYMDYRSEPLGEVEQRFFTAITVVLFSFLVYILMNGLTEFKEESERRLALTLSQEKKHVEVMLRNQRELLNTIDELEKTQKALERTTEQLEQSQIISRQGNYEIDLVTGKTSWSKMTPVLFHYPPGTAPEQVDFDTLMDARERERVSKYREEVLTSKRPVQFTIKIINPKNGRTNYIEVRNFPVENESGKVICIRGAVRDCTIETLYNQSLVTQKEAAEAATHAKASFLSTMSHEIRTPMNAVIGLAQLLLMEKPREDQMESLKTLHGAANHLLGLLNDILDFSKIEANKVEMEQVPVHVNTLLDEVKRLLSLKATSKGLFLEVESTLPPNHAVLGDSLRIKQILTNLMGNAIKFTDQGGVVLKADLVGEEGHEILHLCVKDSGIGIRADDLKAIFESFSQASRNITREYGGTGLGLSICKGLVEAMGGRIWVESEFGHGSEFHVEMPLPVVHDDLQPAQANPTSDYSGDLSRLNVLLVEDNPVNVLVAKKALSTMGISRIDCADNGLKATELATTNRYDLILMDLQMPIMDGLTASMNIRKLEDPSRARVPIIALTASVSAEVRHRIAAIGINGFATKPFVIKDLETVIREHLPAQEAEA